MTSMSIARPSAGSLRRQTRHWRRRSARFRWRRFGRRAGFTMPPQPKASAAISNNVRLFATTFAAGFLFVSVLIG